MGEDDEIKDGVIGLVAEIPGAPDPDPDADPEDDDSENDGEEPDAPVEEGDGA